MSKCTFCPGPLRCIWMRFLDSTACGESVQVAQTSCSGLQVGRSRQMLTMSDSAEIGENLQIYLLVAVGFGAAFQCVFWTLQRVESVQRARQPSCSGLRAERSKRTFN